MDFFSRTSFPARDPFMGRMEVSLGCPQCAELKRRAAAAGAGAQEVIEEELSCSKCKKKKRRKATPSSFAVEASRLPPEIVPSGMGQSTPAVPTPPAAVAIVAPVQTSPWVLAAGLLGVVGIGYWAASS